MKLNDKLYTSQIPLVADFTTRKPHSRQNFSFGSTLVPHFGHTISTSLTSTNPGSRTITLDPQLLQNLFLAVRGAPHTCPSSVFPAQMTIISDLSISLEPHSAQHFPSPSNPQAGSGHFFTMVTLYFTS